VDIGALLVQVLPGIRGACAPDVAVSGDIAPDLPPVAADTERLVQALTNVVENAGDSLSGVLVPEIVVRAEARYLTRAALDATRLADNVREGTFVVISVEDNGEGVPADALPWIFDPFFSTRFTGRGLGLAAVHGIVRRHGGTIAVRSEQEQGTMISIMLPVLDDASAREAAG
jgi:nitrogen-specific signal transduction histidine kinase